MTYQMLVMDRVVEFAIDQRVAKNLHKCLILRRCRSTCLRWSYLRLMAYSICIFHQFFVCVWSQFWLAFVMLSFQQEKIFIDYDVLYIYISFCIKRTCVCVCWEQLLSRFIIQCGPLKIAATQITAISNDTRFYCRYQLACCNWIQADVHSYTLDCGIYIVYECCYWLAIQNEQAPDE